MKKTKFVNMGPSTPFSQHIHATKYRGENETFREAMNRISTTLSDGDLHFRALRDILLDMRFIPAGRIQAAIGSTKRITPYNCFVSGTIEDSLVDGAGSIMNRLTDAVTTMRMGGGIGYDFSTLRPRGSAIKKLHSRSCGPVKLMNIFDAACHCIVSTGHRRGAQMGVMRIDHPDILEFVRAKQNEDRLTGFNVSVGVTDEFMIAVKEDTDFKLVFRGEVYETIRARDLWETIMRSTWDWAEPGILFIDRINGMNNLRYCENICATNPCGEQPLPPFGACLLGSFNLVKYLDIGPDNSYTLNLARLETDIPHVVRGMDNVVDRAIYPLYEQEKEAHSKRRMGLGITGLANTLETLGAPYGSEKFISLFGTIMSCITNAAYRASARLAKEKGSFPLYSAPDYLNGAFIKNLKPETLELIKAHGIRNSHLISIAPTGTISIAADNVSSGIEPVFAYEAHRTVIEEDGPKEYDVVDYAYSNFGVKGKTVSEVTVNEHLAVLIEAYRWVDSAVSKTCNVPSTTSWDDFKKIYVDAWAGGCKGCTTYQVGGKRGAILKEKVGKDEEKPAEGEVEVTSYCKIDSETGRKECE